jgi:hypothetical protein
MLKTTEGGVYSVRYDSVSELAADCETNPHERDGSPYPDFHGVESVEEAFDLARNGWAAELERTLNVAETAVTKVERDLELPTFSPEHGVAGSEVDIARFLDGTPENMIDYPLRPIVRAGRVITLCASISYSGSVETETIIRRGQAIAALALALSQLGYSCELWTDFTATENHRGDRGLMVQVRTLVKGAQDALDPERIAYAFAHPSMLRCLNFSPMRRAPHKYITALGLSRLGYPHDPIEDMPEGTLYTPCVLSDHDVPDADEQLVAWLKQLEIVPEDD